QPTKQPPKDQKLDPTETDLPVDDSPETDDPTKKTVKSDLPVDDLPEPVLPGDDLSDPVLTVPDSPGDDSPETDDPTKKTVKSDLPVDDLPGDDLTKTDLIEPDLSKPGDDLPETDDPTKKTVKSDLPVDDSPEPVLPGDDLSDPVLTVPDSPVDDSPETDLPKPDDLPEPVLQYIDIHESNSLGSCLSDDIGSLDKIMEMLAEERKVDGTLMSKYSMYDRASCYHGCCQCNNDWCEGLTSSRDTSDSVEIWGNGVHLVLPHDTFIDDNSALEQCRTRLGLYGLELTFVRMLKKAKWLGVKVGEGENGVVTLRTSQRPDGTCVPIYCQFGNHIYKIHIFITSRDARYIRSEISKLLALPRQEIQIEDRLTGDVLHGFGGDLGGHYLPIADGVGTLDNPIIVRLSNEPNCRARIAYEEGFLGNRPVVVRDERSVFNLLKDPDVLDFQKTFVAARYLHDAWKDRPAVIERRNDMRRIIAIGDIHANADLIPQIDAIIRNNPNASIVFTGDYVERGAPNPDGSESGIQNNIEVLCAMALWQIEFPDRVTFLRGNHETREANQQHGLWGYMCRRFGSVIGADVWEAINLAFDELPIAAWLGRCFACHGGVHDGRYDLSDDEHGYCQHDDRYYDLHDFKKENADKKWTDENNVLWNDINLVKNFIPNKCFPNGRGSGFTISPDRQIEILENLMYSEELVRPEFFIKGHQHDLGSKCHVGTYRDGTPVAVMCTIGNYPKKDMPGLGYWDIDQEAGTAVYYDWKGKFIDRVQLR
ncbi:MAG: metallophosphoesterase, partial [Oscillospiraceae bacterium]|nr:metallophosphoesterase [Oscillospiraceae bacterium]